MKPLHLVQLCVISLVFSACASTFGTQKWQTSEHLPRIENLKYLVDMTSVAFEWDSLYDESIDGFLLYRSNANAPEMSVVATIKDKYQTHFVDKELTPNTQYTYTMRSFKEGFVSKSGEKVSVKTQDRMEAMPFVQGITNLPNRIKLIWRPHPDLRVSSYVIERAGKDGKFRQLAEVKGRLNAEYIDKLGANESYKYRVYAKSFDGVHSASSEVINATSKDLPPTVRQLSAATQGGKIILSWQSVEYKDLAYYQIYSSSSTFLPFTKLAKTKDTTYTDTLNEPNKTRSYKITAVDKDGLESPMPKIAVTGKTVASPKAPSIVKAAWDGAAVVLEWKANDIRAVQYIIKRYGAESVVYRDLTDTAFTDNAVIAGQNYEYEVIAVDENGYESKASKRVAAK